MPVTPHNTTLADKPEADCALIYPPPPPRLSLSVLRFAGIQILKATQKGRKSETRI